MSRSTLWCPFVHWLTGKWEQSKSETYTKHTWSLTLTSRSVISHSNWLYTMQSYHHDQWLVECCFTSTESVGLLGTGAQDGHLDFHTAPESPDCDRKWLTDLSTSIIQPIFYFFKILYIYIYHINFVVPGNSHRVKQRTQGQMHAHSHVHAANLQGMCLAGMWSTRYVYETNTQSVWTTISLCTHGLL